MGAVAGAKPPPEVASLTQWHTTEMGADANHHDPVFPSLARRPGEIRRGLLTEKIRISGYRVLEFLEFDSLSGLDFFWRSVANEYGAASPLGGERHSWFHRGDVNLDRGKGAGRGIRTHLIDEWPGYARKADNASHTGRDIEEIASRRFACRGIWQDTLP